MFPLLWQELCWCSTLVLFSVHVELLGARRAQPLLWELTPPSSPSSVLSVCQQLPTQGGLVAF